MQLRVQSGGCVVYIIGLHRVGKGILLNMIKG